MKVNTYYTLNPTMATINSKYLPIMLFPKMRLIHKKKLLSVILVTLTIIILLHPINNARNNYEFIEKRYINDNLHAETISNFTSTALADCDYRDIIFDESSLSPELLDEDLIKGHRIKEGGEYSPNECKPKFSVALIVPFREKAEQLRAFLVYMHTYLRRQKIHYRIFVVEQVDTKPFNRAKLFNIGAVTAIHAGFPCLILHDLDLLPLKPSNLYACTTYPRHMSSSIDSFRFVLPYLNLLSGVIAIVSKQYKAINGMSNNYYGREDNNDLYTRIKAQNLKLCRFQKDTSQYHLVKNKIQFKSERQKPDYLIQTNILEDGLTTLKYTEVASVLHPLFTHLMVDL